MNPKLLSLLKSAAIAAGGAAAAYVLAYAQSGTSDLGVAGPLVAALASWLVNLLKVYAEPPRTA